VPLQRQGMTTFTELAFAPSGPPEPFTDRLRLAVAAYLARFKGSSREHTESDLCCYLAWCAEHGLDPLAARRHLGALTLRACPPSRVPAESPTLVATLGLLGLRIFEAAGADIADLGEEHGHRVLRVCGSGTKVVLVPLPPAVGRAIDRAIGDRTRGPAQPPRSPDGPACGHLPPASTRRGRRYPGHQGASPHAPPHIRHDHARARSCIGCNIPSST
jgi:integrase